MKAQLIIFLEYKASKVMFTLSKNEKLFDVRMKASFHFNIDPQSFIMKYQNKSLSKCESYLISDYFRRKSIVTIFIEELPSSGQCDIADGCQKDFSFKNYLLNLSILSPSASEGKLLRIGLNQSHSNRVLKPTKGRFKINPLINKNVSPRLTNNVKELENNLKHIKLLKFETGNLKQERVDSSPNEFPKINAHKRNCQNDDMSQLSLIRYYTEIGNNREEISINVVSEDQSMIAPTETDCLPPIISEFAFEEGSKTKRLKQNFILEGKEGKTSASSPRKSFPGIKKIRFMISETSDPTQFINMDRRFKMKSPKQHCPIPNEIRY